MKLKRLHFLRFGTDLALENNDVETALALSLRLASFIDTECLADSDTDSVFINPLIKENLGKIDTFLHLLSHQSDRRACEQASCKDNTIFCNKGNVDLKKIKNLRYFKPLLQNINSCCKKQVPSQHSGSSHSSFFLQRNFGPVKTSGSSFRQDFFSKP